MLGQQIDSGSYFYKRQANDSIQTREMVLLKWRSHMKKIFIYLLIILSTIFAQKIACVGSSITANGYPEIVDFWMEQDGYKWDVLNFGVPGSGVLKNAYKDKPEFQVILDLKPNYVVIFLGGNDRYSHYPANKELWKSEYEYLAISFKNKGSKIILGTIIYNLFLGADATTIEINKWITDYGKEKGYHVIDFNSAFGLDPANYQADGIHPSTAGKYVLAKKAYNYLKTLPINNTSDTIPPAKPTNFTATAGDGKVELSWNSNTEPDLNHYNLFKGTLQYGSMDLLASVDKNITSYVDNTVINETTYYYKISAIDNFNNQSTRTAQVAATPIADTPPSTPSNFNASVGLGTVTLSWDANTEPDLANYKIYRGIVDGGWIDLLATVDKSSTSYIDMDINPNTAYFYKIAAGDVSGNNSTRSAQISAMTLKLLNENQFAEYSIKQNVPNPFNPKTEIEYSLPIDSQVLIIIYDLLGDEVITLLNQNMPSGNHNVVWDGTNNSGQKVVGGIYIYKLQANDFIQTRKMVLLK